MNKKMVFYMIGRIILIEAALLVLPLACSLIYKEQCFKDFLLTISIALLVGSCLTLFNRTKDKTIFAKEGFVIVALAWIALSAVGSLPFMLSGAIPSFPNAFFETVSGFTTTGASILKEVESLPRGILFWRNFTNWIGGMGILVLVMAIFPTDTGRSIHIMRAEMPGPIVGKLVPKVSGTAKILYLIYIFMTTVQIILMLLGGMPLYDSIVHSLATAGTGGFSINNDSIGGYSNYIQWVITIFMLLFGVNFNLYYLILIRKAKAILKSEELISYVVIVVIATATITLNIVKSCSGLGESIRLSAFQVASIISTTGFTTADFDLWPSLSKGILYVLMFLGACAGSTAGGLKVSRLVLLFKTVRANLKHMIHTRSVETVHLEGKRVDNSTITGVCAYFALYFLCFAVIFLILCIEPFDLETNISAVATCFNNIGPGFSLVGPTQNFSIYSSLSKFVLSAAMLLGRLEIFPMILLFSPAVWIKKRTIQKISV